MKFGGPSPRRVLLAGVLAVAAAGCRRLPGSPTVQGASADCHREIAESELWTERSDQELHDEILRARSCAVSRNTRVLLEFGGTWCPDCVAMTQLESSEPVAGVLRERFERVRVNVGAWDRHRDLLRQFHITRVAAYVVMDPSTGAVIAQRTAEPRTGEDHITPASWADWLRSFP